MPCVMVIFGASGDLTKRKLIPALYKLGYEGLLDERFSIVGFARTQKTHEQFRNEMREAVLSAIGEQAFSQKAWDSLARRLYYFVGRYDEIESYRELHRFLEDPEAGCGCGRYLYYVALPPRVTESVLRLLKQSGCVPRGEGELAPRIMIEKPFGMDLESARRQNKLLLSLFEESKIYRIDHYIAKDTVRNLLVFRFANAIFEPVWNRHYIDNVQITAGEEIGVEGRGAFYDEVGVVRDMVQSHVLQVLSFVAMEPPLGGDIESVRDKKVEVFRAIAPPGKGDFVFGQYRGYRNEPDVRKDSTTPTFVAGRFFIENWRWHGVPFYIRTGKRLAKKVTEVVIEFKRVPLCILPDQEMCAYVRPNMLVIRIQPDEGIKLCFSVQVPGRDDRAGQANLDFRYAELGQRLSEAYERVLLDGMLGRPGLFWRADGIESAWRVVEPMLEEPALEDLPSYEPGSSGPEESEELLRRDGRAWLTA